jgi:hypothetical protein
MLSVPDESFWTGSEILSQQVFVMVGESEVGLGVVIANIADHLAEELIVVREFPVLDVLAHDVAKEAAEVFVAWEGEERAGIGEHPHKVGEETDG